MLEKVHKCKSSQTNKHNFLCIEKVTVTPTNKHTMTNGGSAFCVNCAAGMANTNGYACDNCAAGQSSSSGVMYSLRDGEFSSSGTNFLCTVLWKWK